MEFGHRHIVSINRGGKALVLNIIFGEIIKKLHKIFKARPNLGPVTETELKLNFEFRIKF